MSSLVGISLTPSTDLKFLLHPFEELTWPQLAAATALKEPLKGREESSERWSALDRCVFGLVHRQVTVWISWVIENINPPHANSPFCVFSCFSQLPMAIASSAAIRVFLGDEPAWEPHHRLLLKKKVWFTLKRQEIYLVFICLIRNVWTWWAEREQLFVCVNKSYVSMKQIK